MRKQRRGRYGHHAGKLRHLIFNTMDTQEVKEVISMLSSLRHFSKDEIAQERMRIISFYEEYGETPTRKAFGVSRKTIWVWKKRFKLHQHHLAGLIPSSTRPKTVRRMMSNPQVVEYIKKLRETYPRLGKEKIKPLLDSYCQKEGIALLATSTIGKIIKRHHLFFQRTRFTHYPVTNSAKKIQPKRERVRYAPKPTGVGYIEMDTVIRFVQGIKVYFYSAIDVVSKFSFSLRYASLTSQNTVDFFQKLEMVFPYLIHTVQTDNGLEFLGHFEEYLKRKGISHVFIYPRQCKVNGVVERYQRTFQEEFVDNNLEVMHDPKLFHDKLVTYLLFYNTRRVHKSLGLQTPVDYLIWNGEMSKMFVTHTTRCKEEILLIN